jgi:aminoglycoside phosphotransferase family enzyme
MSAELATEPDLVAKVAALKNPRAYPEPPGKIEAVETHMSWVFLTPEFAYKLKKPVRYAYLDFSTLAARARYCAEEVRLNQRLAPGVYLGVAALTQESDGRVRINGEGEVVEWLVKMRRLPLYRMLDSLIRRDAVLPEDIQRLALLLALFYRESPPVETRGEDYRREYETKLSDNLEVLGDPASGLTVETARAVHARLAEFARQTPGLLAPRAEQNRILEGHGDLRPEHVCLEARPVIFDRLEFNREFRLVDAVDELASLAMECERLGAAWIGRTLLDVYAQTAGDQPPPALLHFYMSYRACLRARLAILHTRELPRAAWDKWRAGAADYLRLAAAHAERIECRQ